MPHSRSDDYSTDESRRAPTNTRQSHKTEIKEDAGKEDKLDKILNILNQQGESMKKLTDKVKEIRIQQGEYRDEVKMLREENDVLKRECRDTKEQNNEIKKNSGEVRERKKVWKKVEVEKFMREKLEVQTEINAAHKLGEKTFITSKDKDDIMSNKQKLTHFKEQKVYISNDLTEKERYTESNKYKGKERKD
ncbi:hypothetical protein FQA39_LY02733 [Lamprigera yunnana]|nr:hypothetical protein FQA39_LY02733 [Lamprigera yunnana]